MEDIIKYHKIIVKNINYVIIDPIENLNKLISVKKNQEEIFNYIKESNLNFIDICYNFDIILRYTIQNNNIIISPIEILGVHLIRLIGLKLISNYSLEQEIIIKNNFINNFLFEINNLFENKIIITNYCTICGEPLKIKNINKIQVCSKQNCLHESISLVLDNRITELYNKDPVLCEFLIQILINGALHPKKEKIFKPFPIIKNINNLDMLNKLIYEENSKNNLNINNILESKSDIELFKKIGQKSYAIINNAISNNYFSISTIQNKIIYNNIPELNSITTDFEQIKFIGFNYTYEIESSFKKKNFLFHGTSLYSWYPIIKNGLKVMSGTEFQTNGAAYGNGIYFSDSFEFSLNYSITNSNTNIKVVGVFEINDDIKKYLKTTNIYVIDNENIILLRYLIIINNKCNNYKSITNYFIKYLTSINKINNTNSINIKNKRLNSEIKLLKSNSNIQLIDTVNFDIFHEIKWIIKLNNINNKSYNLIIYFNDYPKLPPKIILETDLNKNILCNDLLQELNPSNWEANFTLLTIIDKLYNYLSQQYLVI